LARLERAHAITSTLDAERQTEVRRQFYRQLGEVLAPYPEAKQALAESLQRQMEKADEGRPANQDQARRGILKELGRVLAPYPEAKAAVGAFLKIQIENDAPDRGDSGWYAGQRLRPG